MLEFLDLLRLKTIQTQENLDSLKAEVGESAPGPKVA